MTKNPSSYIYNVGIVVLLSLTAMSCSSIKNIKKEDSYPTRPEGTDKIAYSDKKKDTIWGDGESLSSKLFNKEGDNKGSGSGIGVNSFLWRASLDTISFMPLKSADPFGGVILTDWFEDPSATGTRFKLNVYILDRQLRADGVRVSVFKQEQNETSEWKDMHVNTKVGTDIENTILTRARELRITQQATK